MFNKIMEIVLQEKTTTTTTTTTSPPQSFILVNTHGQYVSVILWMGKLYAPFPDLARNFSLRSLKRPSNLNRKPDLARAMNMDEAIFFVSGAQLETLLIQHVANDESLGSALRKLTALRTDSGGRVGHGSLCHVSTVALRQQIQQTIARAAQLAKQNHVLAEKIALLKGSRSNNNATHPPSVPSLLLSRVVTSLRRESRLNSAKLQEVCRSTTEGSAFSNLVSSINNLMMREE